MKENSEVEGGLLSPEVILRAIDGEEQAVMEIIEFYNRLIHSKFVFVSRRKGVNISYMPLSDMKQEVRLLLIKAIRKFET